jgi:hypothetical protein
VNILSLRREWSTLMAPPPAELVGDLQASFVAPLKHVAPAGLGLIGLPRWHGKRFRLEGDRLVGVNLLRASGGSGGLEETLPMTAMLSASWADGLPAVAVSYAADAPRPWRWVRDELRVRSDGNLVGMTFVGLPGLRALGGTPFLLRRG